jgi:hypothetical protein
MEMDRPTGLGASLCRRFLAISISAIASVQAAPAQDQHAKDSPTMGARELYFVTFGKKDSLPSMHRGNVQAASSPAPHLGLRYNLLLVNGDTGAAQQVSSTHIFRAGDCVALDVEANHSGYIYVLAKQSSGAWRPLLPSIDMPDETSVLDPGVRKRVPVNYCLEMKNPPGTETLFVVLSRSPSDISELYRGIRGVGNENPPARNNPTPPEKRSDAPLQMADARLVNDSVEKIAHQFGTRDIAIRRVNQPVSSNEPRGSVYVVNSSSKPTATITTTVQISHR